MELVILPEEKDEDKYIQMVDSYGDSEEKKWSRKSWKIRALQSFLVKHDKRKNS
jgi:hypothetical protein